MIKQLNWRAILAASTLALLVAVSLFVGETEARRGSTEIYDTAANASVGSYRSSVSSDDPDDLSASGVATITTLVTGRCPTYVVNCRFSNASATAEITLLRGSMADATAAQLAAGTGFTIHGYSTSTATAHATITDGTDYMSEDLFFDTGGSPHVKVLVHDISAGDVNVWVTKTSDGS